MTITIDGTNGISTPDLESAGPITGTTATFSGNVTLGSSVLATPAGSAPSYTCRAWVNFNGTGTVAIRASGNVSSITDNGTGDYTVNFATAMPDADYAVSGSASFNNAGAPDATVLSRDAVATSSASNVRVKAKQLLSSATDVLFCNVAIFR